MPQRVETGANKFPPEPFTFLRGNGDKNQIHSVGLIFEPDFFTLYAYADRKGRETIGFSTLATDADPPAPFSAEPLYAFAFTPEWTLVPRATFQPEDAKDHLIFNTTATAKDEAAYDVLPLLDTVVVYRKNPEAEQTLDKVHPGLRMKHLATAALDLMFRSTKSRSEPFLWIHLVGRHAMIAVGRDGSPILANTIETTHPSDLEFFVLFAAKQLGLDMHTDLYLTGQSKNQDQISALLKRHFRIHPPPLPPGSESNEPIEQTLSIKHFIGLFAPACAS